MKEHMSVLLTIAWMVVATCTLAQTSELKVDESLKVPGLKFDSKGELVITASSASSPRDFDFLVGKWKLHHRKLKSRLTHSNEWNEFETIVEDFNILQGTGNMDVGHAVFNGKPWEGRTIRLFDPKTRLWSLYWVTNASGAMERPLVGSFENGVAHFFCKEKYEGKDIIVLFRWDARDKERSKWSQAFSQDNGATWEWNWFNVKERITDPPLKTIAENNFAIPVPPLTFADDGSLIITPSATSSVNDFDYLIGKWTLKHRKLKARLVNSNEWFEFENELEDLSILEGAGNMDFLNDSLDGKPWQGRTFRLFDPATRLWRLYWVASNVAVMDPPVVGSFENGIGHFFTRDIYKGKDIIMMFRWDKRDKDNPIWSQAFSTDNGKTWEWNAMNVSHRSN